MTFLSLLARFFSWLFPAPEPELEPRRRLPVNPPRCCCGHLCVHHTEGNSWCLRCTCSYPEPVTVPESRLGDLA